MSILNGLAFPAAAMLLIHSGTVQAQGTEIVTARSQFSERVPYTATDLASDQAVRSLMSRIYAAADRVCGRAATPGGSLVGEVSARSPCFHPTVQDARLQIRRAVSVRGNGVSLIAASIIVRTQ